MGVLGTGNGQIRTTNGLLGTANGLHKRLTHTYAHTQRSPNSRKVMTGNTQQGSALQKCGNTGCVGLLGPKNQLQEKNTHTEDGEKSSRDKKSPCVLE